MFRQSLRRCVGRVATASLVPRAAPVLRRVAAPSASRLAFSPRFTQLASRAYSTESEAPVAEAQNAVEESDRFESLKELGVHPNILRAIIEGMGYETMTPVQAKTIRPSLNGTDIVAQAKTGTGKTLAFLLPLLQRMINEDPNLASRSAIGTARSTDIRGIVLSPTRELAEQIAAEARKLTRYTGLVVQSAVGGTRKSDMLRQTQRQGCHLMVATPGRLNDILSDPGSGVSAPNLAALVLDEADRMLDVGFEAEINSITNLLPDPSDKVRQTMLVSATIPDNVIRLARNMVRPDDFQFVQTIAQNESLTHDRVPQNVVATSSFGNLFPTLFEIIDRETAAAEQPGARPFKAIVYFNTTALVQLAGIFGQERRRNGNLKVPTISINSKLTQPQREKAASMFKSMRTGILFSSDVTARGMDFPDVTHVIQMDVPTDRETYIHRLGRTARQGKEGTGYLVLPPQCVRQARQELEGLPLTPDNSLECATAALDDETNAIMREMKELGKWVRGEALSTAYRSAFGGFKGNKVSLVDDLNDWVVKGLGLREPPAVSSLWASKMGLSKANLNTRQNEHSYDESSSFGRPSYGQRNQGRRGDSFSSSFNDRVDDDRRGRGGFGSQRGGGGGGRGGYGGGRSRGFENRGDSSW
ncbi:hypothetical protein NLU13_0544 [Sarocladium strictum]|uniref:ATP-dependent RNA helicase n=1 Tax=Sarocladium strictum TaxID=5046 RepID=A0AA39GP92_SARSR|nr:hypothetical protein NLU13_0544 [Sarocladium strictum]